MGRKTICTDYYVFIGVSDGFTKTMKLEPAIQKPYWVSKQYGNPVIIQREELVEEETAHSVALALWLTDLPSIPPKTA